MGTQIEAQQGEISLEFPAVNVYLIFLRKINKRALFNRFSLRVFPGSLIKFSVYFRGVNLILLRKINKTALFNKFSLRGFSWVTDQISCVFFMV